MSGLAIPASVREPINAVPVCPCEYTDAHGSWVEMGMATGNAREAKALRMPGLGVSPMLRKGNCAAKSAVRPVYLLKMKVTHLSYQSR